MEVIILPSPADVGRVAAERIACDLARNPQSVLGLATGSSPLGIYAQLRRLVEAGELSMSTATGFALDEYVGIPPNHPQSYLSVIRREVVEPLGMEQSRVHVPDGRARDLDQACARYEKAITAAGGVDIQILGVGVNGHIGFNEPTSSFASRTRVKTLALDTRAANARFFRAESDVPLHCLTQGIGTILEARRLLLVAQGPDKAPAIASAVEGPVSSICPASALQLHRDVTVIVDESAASQLQLADYYRYVYDNKLDGSWSR